MHAQSSPRAVRLHGIERHLSPLLLLDFLCLLFTFHFLSRHIFLCLTFSQTGTGDRLPHHRRWLFSDGGLAERLVLRHEAAAVQPACRSACLFLSVIATLFAHTAIARRTVHLVFHGHYFLRTRNIVCSLVLGEQSASLQHTLIHFAFLLSPPVDGTVPRVDRCRRC